MNSYKTFERNDCKTRPLDKDLLSVRSTSAATQSLSLFPQSSYTIDT